MSRQDALVILMNAVSRCRDAETDLCIQVTRRLWRTLDPPRMKAFCGAFKAACEKGHQDPLVCEAVLVEATRLAMLHWNKVAQRARNLQQRALAN